MCGVPFWEAHQDPTTNQVNKHDSDDDDNSSKSSELDNNNQV